MWVVKLGGSLGNSPTLLPWLRTLKHANVAIVPGGGAFADTVRRAQQRHAFGDEAAHAMAILAMAQYGLMLQGLEPELETAMSPAAVRDILGNGKSVIWLPQPNDISVKPSWEMTSDSLALWFAGRIGADDLVLIKSASLPPGRTSVRYLLDSNLIDPAFEAWLDQEKTRAWLCHRDRHESFVAALQSPAATFTRVTD